MSDADIWQAKLASSQVIVVLGGGGVGKTTSSIALALLAAKQGKRVGLISIDPAKRLAAALGMSLNGDLQPLSLLDEFANGSVDAAMLDQKAVFDGMVRRHSPSSKVAEKILSNKLYRAASSNLGGAIEYMALAKLQQMVDEADYDVVVIDTPPDAHALDFLSRPNILASFFDNKVMAWLIKPFVFAQKFGLGKVAALGEKMMGGLAEVTGVKALQMLSEFLLLMQEVLVGFNKSGERLQSILQSASTAFVLVSAPRAAAVRAAENVAAELSKRKFALRYLLINRCMPDDLLAGLQSLADQSSRPGERTLAAYKRMAVGQQQVIERLLAAVVDRSEQKISILRSDETSTSLGDLAALCQFAKRVRAASWRT